MTDLKMMMAKGMQPFQEVAADVVHKEVCNALQVENLNFLLGAGCSSLLVEKGGKMAEVGIPAMSGLFNEFKAANPGFRVSRHDVFDKCDKNIEKLLEILESVYRLNDFWEADAKAESKILKIQEFLRGKITEGMKSRVLIDLYKDFYERISQRSKHVTPISVFTTNYDLFSECALDELRYPYNNGFMGVTTRRFVPASFDYSFVENMNLKRDAWEPVPSYFNLIKLHGSISWVKGAKEDVVYERLADVAEKEQRMMIYPSPLKDRSTLMTPYSDLFRVMENRLVRKNAVLIVIGYSFGDDHINRLIYNALESPSFRLIILNGSDAVKKLAEERNPRVTIAYSPDGDEKLHYFKGFVEKLLPAPNPEVEEGKLILRKFGGLIGESMKV